MERNRPSRNFLAVLFFWFGILLALNPLGFCQDPGQKDSLIFYPQDCNFTVVSYHDEPLSGFAVPLKYKNSQTDISLDSVKFYRVMEEADLKDSIIDRENGTVVVYAIWFDSTPPARDTFFTLFFTPGPSWNPAIPNKLDTFRLESGQGLSFTDLEVHDILPHFIPPTGFGKGCLEVWQKMQKTEAKVPPNFFLGQNLPNPFNAETVIAFGLPQASQVRLEVFNILGQSVRLLVNGQMPAGYHNVAWDGRNAKGKKVVSGIYFYKLKTESFADVKKMSLVK